MPKRSSRSISSSQPTIFDVAKEAGVAISTVSLALHGDEHVSAKTRQAVLKAALKLRYQPNLAAQSLARRQTNLIAVCGWYLPDTLDENSYAPIQMLMGIQARLKGTRYAIYLVNWSYQPEEHRRLLEDFNEQRFICGSIWLTSSLEQGDLTLIRRSAMPVVLAEAVHPELDSVALDNIEAARIGAQHLLRNGRPLIVVTSLPGLVQSERLEGVRRAVAEAGQEWKGVRRYVAAHYSYNQGLHIAQQLAPELKRSKRGASIFCLAGDICAIGLLTGLRSAGLRIPGLVAVLGFDGMNQGQYSVPTLSTVAQPLNEIGFKAASALLDRLDRPESPQQRLRLQAKLVLRASA